MKTAAGRERREHERVRLSPMYTSVVVEPKMALKPALLGHAYDISESGVRLELDEPLDVGQRVTLHLGLHGDDHEIHTDADVMWVNDEFDDPGPRRMAMRFTRFHSPADRMRLAAFLVRGLHQIAA